MCSDVNLGRSIYDAVLKESSGTAAVHSGLGSEGSLLGSLSSSLSMPVRGTVRRMVKGRSPRLKEKINE